MSHFSVLVFLPPEVCKMTPTQRGEALTKALDPFHEFECTGTVNEFVQSVDITQEYRDEFSAETANEPDSKTFTEWLKEQETGRPILSSGETPDLEGDHKWGWIQLNDLGCVAQVIRRTNPNKKWDWWVIGGRWRERLTLKDGTKVDSSPNSLVDWEGMREAARVQALEDYALINATFKGLEWPPCNWSEFCQREEFKEGEGHPNYDKARAAWATYPAIVAYDSLPRNHKLNLFLGDPRLEYCKTEEEFVSAAVNKCGTTYAMLIEGNWISKGEMGWFGMASNECSQDEWNKRFHEAVRSRPDDFIVVVDCHI